MSISDPKKEQAPRRNSVRSFHEARGSSETDESTEDLRMSGDKDDLCPLGNESPFSRIPHYKKILVYSPRKLGRASMSFDATTKF